MQIPPTKKIEMNLGKTQSYSWSQIDLFDENGEIKRGKFKVPLYVGPTDVTISANDIGKLEPIENHWLFLRITFPNDEEFNNIKSIYPEETIQEYSVPYIHLRGLFGRNYETSHQNITKKGKNDNLQLGKNQQYKVVEHIEEFQPDD